MVVGGGRVLSCHIGALNPVQCRPVAAQAVSYAEDKDIGAGHRGTIRYRLC